MSGWLLALLANQRTVRRARFEAVAFVAGGGNRRLRLQESLFLFHRRLARAHHARDCRRLKTQVGGNGRVVAHRQRGGDGRTAGFDDEIEIDGVDQKGRRGVVLEIDGLRGIGFSLAGFY